MTLQFTKAERINLKTHPELSEKWVQDRIIEDPGLLGLGDVEFITAEKIQHKAGRLDLLLHDDQLNRRYEVELMLGATDPSHIIRCIEYWDIEKRRYPAYDHVAVLVAEDITSRFLNVMSLLAGNIPLIALQLVALRVDDKILLHLVNVLDQTVLRTDDQYELTGGSSGPVVTDRYYWDARASAEMMRQCEAIIRIASQVSGVDYDFVYRRRIVDVVERNSRDTHFWLIPRKTLVRIGAYVDDPEAWVKKFDDIGQSASLRRGNKAAIISFKPREIQEQGPLLCDFFRDALGVGEISSEQ